MRPISPIPRVHADVRGVISLRGVIVEVIDLRCRLKLQAAEPTRSSRIIVVQDAGGMLAGLVVDSVIAVMRIAATVTPGFRGQSVNRILVGHQRHWYWFEGDQVRAVDNVTAGMGDLGGGGFVLHCENR